MLQHGCDLRKNELVDWLAHVLNWLIRQAGNMASDYKPYANNWVWKQEQKYPMKYIGAWWEPKFAWWPTQAYDPPPQHDDLIWPVKTRSFKTKVWLRHYLRRKCMTPSGKVFWMNIRYEGPNGLGAIIR